MAKSVKSVKKKGRNKYKFSKNKITAQRKALKKKHIPKEAAIMNAWDASKSSKGNLDDIGLVYDLNKFKMEVDRPLVKKRTKASKQSGVIGKLETDSLIKQVSKLRLPHNDVLYCVHMLERYNDDYVAMAKDSKNHYQDTPVQIKQKIDRFRKSHQYNTYLKAKSDVIDD